MQRVGRFLVLVLFFVLFVHNPLLHAQRTRPETETGGTMDEAFIQARADAKEDVSKIKWLGCGCLGSIYGVGAAYLWGRSPDQTRFMGKSSDYIYAYTKQYKSSVRSTRVKYALLGCGVSGALAMTGFIIALSQEECDPSCGLDEACADPLGINSCLESFEGMGCYDAETGCKSPEACQDEADCATGESCGNTDGCSSGDGCSSSSSSCGGSADYLTK